MKKLERRTNAMYLESIQKIYNIVPVLYSGRFKIERKDDSLLGRFLGWWIAVGSWVATGFKEWNGDTRSFVFFNKLYLPNGFFDAEPKRQYGLLLHELAHVNHQYFDDPDLLFSNTGNQTPQIKGFWFRLWWNIKYVFNPAFRSEVEKCGYLQQIRIAYDYYRYIPSQIKEWFVDTFCSGSYAWMMSREEAEALFDMLERQVQEECSSNDWTNKLFLGDKGIEPTT